MQAAPCRGRRARYRGVRFATRRAPVDKDRVRIVSLVPSLTETLFDFGLGDRVVGRTRWCVEPAGRVESVETVGGTKNPDVERIVALAPDLVIVNAEENRIEDFRALAAAGLRVHVTHPRSVEDAIAMLEALGEVCGARRSGEALAADCRQALAACDESRHGRAFVSTFCPIWRRPYMTFRRATYIGDVLARAGCDNVFGERGGGDFFEVSPEEILAAKPELVVLPDEPYAFEARHADEMRALGLDARFELVDGKDLSWYGPRLPRALRTLAAKIST